MNKSPATLTLEKRREQLQPHIVQVSPNVWVSVAEDVSNVAMIRGKDGLVLVDTGMIPDRAAVTLEAFRKLAPLDHYPIKAIIYTHGHGDHTGGSPVFCAEGSKPEIWARDNFGAEVLPFERAGLMPLFKARGGKQGGFLLPPEKRICNGISPVRYPRAGGAVFSGKTGAVLPDHFFSDDVTLEIAGLKLHLFASPGETDDALSVWFPEERVLFCGDDLYRSFPNIYPVRGTGNRDIPAWCSSLKRLESLDADVLVPGHTDPFTGKDHVKEVLANYREALEYVFDKTIEGMNAGKTPDELAREVRLPEHLSSLDYLEEAYGNVSWTVRNIFNSLVGWFDGNPLHLVEGNSPEREALHMAALAGGEEALFRQAQNALALKDAIWAARLADHLLALTPREKEYLNLKAEALEILAEEMLTATGRNYTFSVAQELRSLAEKTATNPEGPVASA